MGGKTGIRMGIQEQQCPCELCQIHSPEAKTSGRWMRLGVTSWFWVLKGLRSQLTSTGRQGVTLFWL